MKAAWYERKGPAKTVMEFGERDQPEPEPGELLIRVRASGVNPSDTKGRNGARGNVTMPFPFIIPHQDGAGEVVAAGSPQDASRIGERVWFYEAQLGRALGSAAEFVTVPAYKAVPLPASVSFDEGACLGVPAMTAHFCVFADGPVKGKTVFVSGGGGAVGRYAIQFAKLGGARVIASTSGSRNQASAKAAGADLVIDRQNGDVAALVGEFTGDKDGRGIDRFVEVAFGLSLPLISRTLSPNGVVAAYSSDAEAEPKLPFWTLVGLNCTIRFVLVYTMSKEAHQAAAAAINEALAAGTLSHDIGQRFPLSDIVKAHEAVEQGGNGKTIVHP